MPSAMLSTNTKAANAPAAADTKPGRRQYPPEPPTDAEQPRAEHEAGIDRATSCSRCGGNRPS
jgi:hypothetical protein